MWQLLPPSEFAQSPILDQTSSPGVFFVAIRLIVGNRTAILVLVVNMKEAYRKSGIVFSMA